MADAKLVWDMDTGPAEKKADALGKKLQGLGDKAPNFEKSIKGLAQMLAKAALLDRALGAVAEGFVNASNAAAGNSKKAGGARLERDLNLQRLGLGDSGNALIEGSRGGASIEDRDALLSALANKGVDQSTATKALRLGASGVFSQKEIMEGADYGTLDALMSQQGQRIGRLSAQGQMELGVRTSEADLEIAKAQENGKYGQSARLAQGQAELSDLQNPAAAGVRDAVKAFLPSGAAAVVSGVERGAYQLMQLQKLEDINQGMKGKLNLSAGTEGTR